MIDFINVKNITCGGANVKQVSLNGDVLWEKKQDTVPYLCFTAETANATLSLTKKGKPPSVALEQSSNGRNWTEYTAGSPITLQNIGDKVYLRGNNSGFGTNIVNYWYFTVTGEVSASGNVMSLVDKTCASTIIPSNYCFFSLFNGCTRLTSAPELPATTLATHCYDSMFNGCTRLTSAPELPATTLATYCYNSMFFNCRALTSVRVAFVTFGSQTSSWLANVAASGVFYCPSNLTETRGPSGIPENWTIVRTD